MKRENEVTMGGKPITLVGEPVKVGEKAPDFTAVNTQLKPVDFSSFKDKYIVLSSVPSLDTSVCAKQTRKINREVDRMSEEAMTVTVSMDLPFAQKRWCKEHDLENIVTLSDHKKAEFGNKYGLLIDEHRLLARAVFIIDKDGVVQYKQLVPEISKEPDYEKVLDKLGEILDLARA